MVKSYLKFEPYKSFGVVTANSSNIVWTPANSRSNSGPGFALVGANNEVLYWDLKRGELVGRWHDEGCRALVTCIAQSQMDKDVFAIGYDDGTIRLWDSKIMTCIIRFNGHKSAVVTLAFDKSGTRLASGSRDTDIIVWDLVAETGQYKLRGHKDQVTGLYFVEPDFTSFQATSGNDSNINGGFLISTGKDSLIKLWDLSSQYSIETHIAQTNGECWALGISQDQSTCITAGNDGELKVWYLDVETLHKTARSIDAMQDSSSGRHLQERGTLYRNGKDRALEVIFHPQKEYFMVHGTDKSVEIFRERSDAEIRKSLARKRRRRREKALTESDKMDRDEDTGPVAGDSTDISAAEISDIFTSHHLIRTSGKVRSVAWSLNRAIKDLQLVVATTNNQLELYNVTAKNGPSSSKKDEAIEYSRVLAVELPGHRTDIRTLALSNDDRMLATASNGSLKIWNIKTNKCIRTFECGYALCCSFLPGDKVVIVGTKAGELQLFDIASSALLDTIPAHDDAIWSLQVHPSGLSVVTGSADKSVKFWNFKIDQETILGTTRTTPQLRLVQSRLLKVSDDVLCLRFSPDSRLLAVALLDYTVKVFFTDSLKLYLNLYGHTLPVLSMDISYDCKLIVTCSADKKIRIWGLDFGDCHRALIGHQDSILQVAFIPHNSEGNGHHFFSCGKDRLIKYWDADKFELIQRLEGHHGEVWAMAVSKSGSQLVTASHDKSIRLWSETEEQIFLEEEREKEIEELYESTLTASLDTQDTSDTNEVGVASKQTTETLMAGERIMEALQMGMEDLTSLQKYETEIKVNPNIPKPQRNPIYLALGNISAESYLLNVLQKIKPAALQDALLVLPYSHVSPFFTFLNIFAARSMNMPLTCRILSLMLKTHHRQIVSHRTMRSMLDGIRRNLREALKRQKDEMGFNIAALQIVNTQLQENMVKDFVDEHWDDNKEAGVRKRTFLQVL